MSKPQLRQLVCMSALALFGAAGLPAGTPVEAPNQRCQGDAGYNNFFGKGMVDALKAVTAK